MYKIKLTKRYYSGHTEKNIDKLRITNCTQLPQRRIKTSRQNACVHDQRSDSHWWHQSASHKWSRKQQFDTFLSITESRLLRAANVTWCWLL